MNSTKVEPNLTLLYRWIEERRFPQTLALELDAHTAPQTVALAIAKALLCHRSATSDCACRSCTLLAEGTHPDTHWFMDKTAGIDDVRHISRLNSLSATLGHGRLIGLANAEQLNLNAANALLKTLEEPNPGVHFLLFTRHFESILPTIQSRLRRVSYHSRPEHLQAHWEALLKEDKAAAFLKDFFSVMHQEKLPSELAQAVQTQGLLQGLEWLYLAFMALFQDSSTQQAILTPGQLYKRYPFERYNQSVEHIKELMQLVKQGSALQPLLTIEAILVPYVV